MNNIFVRFASKPLHIGDVKAAQENETLRAEAIKIIETTELSTAEYDAFIQSFLSDRNWCVGKGGCANGRVQVIEVTAPDRQPLYINPEGYSYARYVGFKAPDNALRFPDVRVQLSGRDGNAFAVLGQCQRAARKEGVSGDQIKEFMAEASGGDYDHLLVTCMRWFNCA